MLYIKIKLLYATNRNRKPFFNIFNHYREFSIQIRHEKFKNFIIFQLQTALESHRQHQMSWNLAYKSIFTSSIRINHQKNVNRNSSKNEVNVRFFSILPHSGISKFITTCFSWNMSAIWAYPVVWIEVYKKFE
jgi:hypothetical protein